MNSRAFWCCHFQRQQWGYSVAASWVPYHMYDTRYHPPRTKLRLSTPHNSIYITRPRSRLPPKKNMKTRYFTAKYREDESHPQRSALEKNTVMLDSHKCKLNIMRLYRLGKLKKKRRRYPCGLAHEMSGVSYRPVANRRQPQLGVRERGGSTELLLASVI